MKFISIIVPSCNDIEKCNSKYVREILEKENYSEIESLYKDNIQNSKDDCVLLYVETAFELYCKQASKRNFEILNVLSQHFDGYISEFIIDKFWKIENDDKLFNYFLVQLYTYSSHCIYLVESYKHHYSIYSDEITKNKINTIILNTNDEIFKSFLISLIQ